MLVLHAYKFEVSKNEIFRKGTIAILTTFLSGLLFSRQNMMIAFVLVLGSNILSLQNFRVKLVEKTIQLILFDWFIVIMAYIASLNLWWGIPLNLVMIFGIIYLAMSPFDPLRYKTFMMLYVFSQYTAVTLVELPRRLGMVVFAVGVVVMTNYMQQRKDRSLLPETIKKSFLLLGEQLEEGISQEALEANYEAVYEQMRTLAYVIYRTSYQRYFTTYLGRVQFHFYLNISYLNLLVLELNKKWQQEISLVDDYQGMKKVIGVINDYFERKIKRQVVIDALQDYLALGEKAKGLVKEINEVIYALKKNFEELESLDQKKNYKVYQSWRRSELSKVNTQAKRHFNHQNISFNFALRMAVILTMSLLLAGVLGYYKFIWAIIPIMSITQPYYEDTYTRRNDRIKSNILSALLLTLILDVVTFKWIGYLLIIAAFYLVFAYKDYYHYSFFITVISMCISAVDKEIHALLGYRIIYVLLGALIVTIASRIFPYHLKDGIDDLLSHIEEINSAIERECMNYLKGEGNLDLIREAIIHSAILSQKLILQNKQYKSEALKEKILSYTEFCVRIGHRVLREQGEKC